MLPVPELMLQTARLPPPKSVGARYSGAFRTK
jgi:hypothetical protein